MAFSCTSSQEGEGEGGRERERGREGERGKEREGEGEGGREREGERGRGGGREREGKRGGRKGGKIKKTSLPLFCPYLGPSQGHHRACWSISSAFTPSLPSLLPFPLLLLLLLFTVTRVILVV